jgi:hypothetical protein
VIGKADHRAGIKAVTVVLLCAAAVWCWPELALTAFAWVCAAAVVGVFLYGVYVTAAYPRCGGED